MSLGAKKATLHGWPFCAKDIGGCSRDRLGRPALGSAGLQPVGKFERIEQVAVAVTVRWNAPLAHHGTKQVPAAVEDCHHLNRGEIGVAVTEDRDNRGILFRLGRRHKG